MEVSRKKSLTGLPDDMKAVVFQDGKAVVRDDVPIPVFVDDGFMLVKAIAVAVNPSEWKHIDYKLGPEGSILGCEVVGQILKLGPNIIGEKDEFKVGDYVMGFVHGCSNLRPQNGALAEYCLVDSATCYKAPANLKLSGKEHISYGPVKTFEGAVSMPVALTTAGAIVSHEFKLNLEWEPAEVQHDFPILIWGGTTAVGQILIQLVKKLNAYSKIIVVASQKYEKQLKDFGADEVFDYHDPDVISKIKSKYKNIQHLIDAVSNEQTIQQVYKCACDDLPATVMQLVFLNIEHIKPEDRRENVKIIGTIVYLVTGTPITMGPYNFPANPRYRKDIIRFVKFIIPRIVEGDIQHMPVTISNNGLEDVPELIDLVRKGKASNEKFVTILPQ
ncbi:hypothetical protein KAFR_0J02470 [Kazachstania africana CBS 2517]|uniref:Enoyl reductase (ER) domain-containing protein n=1 Tax=Kazachstania africana (strain ATCC 22294 / BCRC 22015 / CBS 2517 / CECT 1963 / NBRC 1671 / NRRL Y-8276) TaxID=1071382 RepID=H2B111_KAZAF|nr:hypothetical protein KAFR_0J02470 [Kazachstania africana CBS 2517]CCF60311.1 hypothetical protein KAFR_0J02470 [Kazachstania africana CBS 2517]